MGGKRRAIAAVALLMTGLITTPAGADDEPSGAAAAKIDTVTLITGDRVSVRDGRVAHVRMAPGREHVRYWRYQLNGHDHVVPDDAARQLMHGQLDPRLFDITGLVAQDYDDAHEPTVPTIVTSGAGVRSAQGMTKVDIPKADAAKAWRERGRTALAGRKVWLNGRVRATLDQSVRQVGAPTAWAAGFRGDGVKVAVLDTGLDATHPDLKSSVDESQDFTGEGPATVDPDGHGTHVASTIAGSGAASGGRYTGVAPGARLLVGKVLGEYGGRESWIIDGMRWAVERGAKVVSMSLGGGPSDGNDLMSQAVNALSASSGALFVIAAGNWGAPGSVDSPGAADRALTVGSVTKSDALSHFSSRGPRFGNYGLKPEISAPGSDIVAARAQGTLAGQSVNERYATLSGTSMATPHVAGAAAILAGQHPDWDGETIKGALTGSAQRLPRITTHEQGAGRLDVARGVGQQVRARGLGNFGRVEGAGRVDREVTYTNDGATPVRLALTLDVTRADGRPVSGEITVDRSVTVPARSSATVTVTARGAKLPAGEFSGVLRAQADGVVLNTPVTANLAGDQHKLTVTVPPRSGQAYVTLLIAQNEVTGEAQAVFSETEVAEFRLSAGRYRVLGRSLDAAFSNTLFALPATVTGDTTLAVDTKQGKRITLGVDDPDARQDMGGGQAIESDVDEAGPLWGAAIIVPGVASDRYPLYTLAGPRMRGLDFNTFSYWNHPWIKAATNGPGGFEFHSPYAPWDLGFTGKLTGRLVDVGQADRAAIDRAGDVTGAIAIIVAADWSNPEYPPGQQMRDGIALLKERGARAVVSYFNPLHDAPSDAPPPALPTIMAFDQEDLPKTQALMRERTVEITLDARPNSPVAYFLADKVSGGLPAGHDFRFRREALGRVDRQFVDTLAPGRYRFMLALWSVGGTTAGAEVETKWPQRRTDYISPSATHLTTGAAGFSDTVSFGIETSGPLTLKPGEVRTSRMFGAPFGPELTTPPVSQQDGKPVPWAYRQGERLTLAVPMFADSDPGNVGAGDETNRGSTVLYRDGKEIARRDDRPALGGFDIPAGPGKYRLVASADRPESALLSPPLSTRTSADWTFRADAGSDRRAALPLLDVRFDLPLDDHNTTAAGEPLVGKVSAVHQPGAQRLPIRPVTVEVSYDDGATWRPAVVRGDRLEIPASSGGFVSLRATARDVVGNSVTETVIRAYAVR